MVKFKTEKHTKKLSVPLVPPQITSLFTSISKKLSFLKWLDPFTYVDLFVIPHVKKITQSSTVEFIVNVFFALIFAWVIYTLLGILFGTSSPLVIVYSASMEPTFFRGDVMALTRPIDSSNFGEVVYLDKTIASLPASKYVSPKYDSGGRLVSFVIGGNEVLYKKDSSIIIYSAYNPSSPDNGKPIIHRAIVKLVALDGNFILTKGDNSETNFTFDQDCGEIPKGFEIPSKGCITLYAIPINELQGKTFFMIPKLGCVKLWLLDDLTSLIFAGALPRDFKGIC